MPYCSTSALRAYPPFRRSPSCAASTPSDSMTPHATRPCGLRPGLIRYRSAPHPPYTARTPSAHRRPLAALRGLNPVLDDTAPALRGSTPRHRARPFALRGFNPVRLAYSSMFRQAPLRAPKLRSASSGKGPALFPLNCLDSRQAPLRALSRCAASTLSGSTYSSTFRQAPLRAPKLHSASSSGGPALFSSQLPRNVGKPYRAPRFRSASSAGGPAQLCQLPRYVE